ncbi:hypothetical protein OG804_12250 [Nocardia sp. NBC_00416]
MMFGLPVIDHRRVPVMTVEYAHLVMQAHIDCPLSACPVKRQAKAYLVGERRVIPGDRQFMGY